MDAGCHTQPLPDTGRFSAYHLLTVQVIHCKAGPGTGRRRNSLNIDSFALQASAGRSPSPAGNLMRGHSLSVDVGQLAAAGTAAGTPLGFCRTNSYSPYPACSSPSLSIKGECSFTASFTASLSQVAFEVPAAEGIAPTTDAEAQPEPEALPAGSRPAEAPGSSSAVPAPPQQPAAQAVLPQPAPTEPADGVGTGQAVAEYGCDATLHDVGDCTSRQGSISAGLSRTSSCLPPASCAAPAANSTATATVAAAAGAAGAASVPAGLTALPQPSRIGPAAGQRGVAMPAGRHSPGPMPIAAAVDATTTELAREIAVMQKLNHPGVVKLFEVRGVGMTPLLGVCWSAFCLQATILPVFCHGQWPEPSALVIVFEVSVGAGWNPVASPVHHADDADW